MGSGRPVGYVMSAESKEKISQALKEHWKRRLPWVEVSNRIKDAVDRRANEEAHALLDEYITAQRKARRARSKLKKVS